MQVGPELELPGYGCEDHFQELDTVEHCWECISGMPCHLQRGSTTLWHTHVVKVFLLSKHFVLKSNNRRLLCSVCLCFSDSSQWNFLLATDCANDVMTACLKAEAGKAWLIGGVLKIAEVLTGSLLCVQSC